MLELAVIIALVVLFLHATTWEGMLLEFVGARLNNLPAWVKKPLYDCPICMAPWWGAIIILLGVVTHTIPHPGWFKDVLVLFAAGGINAVPLYFTDFGDYEETA